MNCPIAIGLTKSRQPSFTSIDLALMLPFEADSSDSFRCPAVFGHICMCALFSRVAIYESFLGLAGGSPVCALSCRSLGARNSSEYRALHVVSAHPLARLLFSPQQTGRQRPVLFMLLAGALTGVAFMFKQVAIVNWLLISCSLSGIRSGRKADGALQFHSPPGQATGLLTVLGFVVLYFFAPRWIARFCRECLHT